jgi:DNA-binding transcriptional regulator YiaG
MTAKQRRAQAERIAAIRHKLQFQQVEFAALLGVHPVTVSKWERAKAGPSSWHMSLIEAIGGTPRDRDIMDCFCSRGIPAALALALEHLHR